MKIIKQHASEIIKKPLLVWSIVLSLLIAPVISVAVVNRSNAPENKKLAIQSYTTNEKEPQEDVLNKKSSSTQLEDSVDQGTHNEQNNVEEKKVISPVLDKIITANPEADSIAPNRNGVDLTKEVNSKANNVNVRKSPPFTFQNSIGALKVPAQPAKNVLRSPSSIEPKDSQSKPHVANSLEVSNNNSVIGLSNCGGSCYLNSLMQQMYNSLSIKKAIIESNGCSNALNGVKGIFEKMSTTPNGKCVETGIYVNKMGFHRGADDPALIFYDYFLPDITRISEKAVSYTTLSPADVLLQIDEEGETIVIACGEPFDPSNIPEFIQLKNDGRRRLSGIIMMTNQLGGHYYSFMRRPDLDEWFKANDSIVNSIGSFDQMISLIKNPPYARILFYGRS